MNLFQKNSKKLNNLRSTFFLVGLIVACSFTFLAFEWRSSYTIIPPDIVTTCGAEEITELPPITYRKEISPPTVKIDQPKPNLDEILIIEIDPIDAIDKTDPIEPTTTIFNPDEWKIVDETPTSPPLPVGYVGAMPHFEACKTLPEEERIKCTQEKMYAHFAEKTHIPTGIKMRGKGTYMAYVYFEVNTKGEVSKVKILNDKKHKIPRELERQAYNAVKSLPQFIAGNNHGKKAVVRYQVPIKFTVK